MKTSTLRVEYDYDFEVFAVISSAKAYRLAWELNKSLNVHLKKAEDLYYEFIKEGRILITNYIHRTDHNSLRLLKNKSCEFYNTSRPFLIPELKEYDYLIQVGGEVPVMETQELQEKIKSIAAVEYIKKIDIKNLKSKENLIF